ncbi:hypothetical protein BGW42_004909 [Actinomortierella wolfii]|nr:hypothetical protein BGW42_004909 [Actinomortierella wolfii]
MCGGHEHGHGSTTATDAGTTFPSHLYAKLTDAHCHIHDDRAAMETLVHAWRSSPATTTTEQGQQESPAASVRAGKFCLMGVEPSSFLGSTSDNEHDHHPPATESKREDSQSSVLPTYNNSSTKDASSSSPLYEDTHVHGDWETVAALAKLSPDHVVPCFGLHPWFTHKYYFDSSASAAAIIAQEKANTDAASHGEGEVTDQFENLSLIRGPGVRGEMAMKTVKALQQQMMASSSSSPPPSTSTTTTEGKDSSSPSQGDPKQHYASILGLPQSAPAGYLDTIAPKLPTPRPLGPALQDLWRRLKEHPTALLGEVGLDRTARVPDPDYQEDSNNDGTMADDGGASPKKATPASKTTLAVTSIEHQLAIVQEQLKIAAELDRAVSFHCVQAYGHWLDFLIRETKKLATIEQQQQPSSKKMSARQRRLQQQAEWERHVESTLSDSSDEDDSEDEDKTLKKKKRDQNQETSHATPTAVSPPPPPPPQHTPTVPKTLPPRLCMHSYGGSVDMIKAFVKLSPLPKMYFSFSIAINGRLNPSKFRELILAVPDDRLLIESDYHSPSAVVDATLVEMAERIANIKGWSIEETVERTAKNWHEFVYGIPPSS